MDRREFLKGASAVAGGAVGVGSVLGACSKEADGATARPAGAGSVRSKPTSILDRPASSCPITHVVVVMMENRSFDHWLGWLAEDEQYLEKGKRRYGGSFHVSADQTRTYLSPTGDPVATAHLPELLSSGNPWRGCDHPDPGHSWNAGRAERDLGFIGTGTGNDAFALGYYQGADLPFTAALARRFAVCDRSHASVLGPTYPNREYLHSAQSGGIKRNDFPPTSAGFEWPTIWDKFGTAGVDAGYYYTDLPVLALWGSRMTPYVHPIADYFTRCAEGTLPSVTFVDPGFLGGSRTDNHPHGDVRAGERFQRDVFKAFAQSPHWQNGLFVLTYDEWGGFFDHKAPPILPDDRASTVDADNFGQAGFRVPTVLASPYAQPGSVDHRLYDHTSVLRFLEWRFLGAPPEGPGRDGATWFLTTRDRRAKNLGASLVTRARPDLEFDVDLAIDLPSEPCASGAGAELPAAASADGSADAGTGAEPGAGAGLRRATAVATAPPVPHSFEDHYHQGRFEMVGYRPEPSPMAQEWLAGLD